MALPALDVSCDSGAGLSQMSQRLGTGTCALHHSAMWQGERVHSELSEAEMPVPGRGCLERENDHKYRTTGRDGPITNIA
jgi:hypothetical protein